MGYVSKNCYGETVPIATNATFIVHGPAPEHAEITSDKFNSGLYDDRGVRMVGVVRDVFSDDIDPLWRFLVMASDGHIVYAAQHVSQSKPHSSKELIGATVSIDGFCQPNQHGIKRTPYRRIERVLIVPKGGLRIVKPAEHAFASLPELTTLAYPNPEGISLDRRFRASGRVLATWDGNTALVRTAAGPIVRAQFLDGDVPSNGESIEVVGFPEYNLFTLGLTSCLWHRIDPIPLPEPVATNMAVRSLLEDDSGRAMASVSFHGRTIRIEGTVYSTRGEGLDHRMILSADGYLIPVDAGASHESLVGMPVGSRVGVTGVCVMNIDDWRPSAPFPRVRGFMIVVRDPSDIEIISLPPWWTPRRLATLLFSVFAVLCLSALLNVVLRRHIARRSRQLAQETSERLESECKVRERTRLAIELHDAISQNLTGVAFQLQTVRNSKGDDANAARHLEIAERTLGSCRDELRNCLWDLRNNALECTDINDAIRQTLAPHIGDARLTVRFDVARTLFTDNFTHALLHVVRELVSNAIRHGHAKRVKVAGCIDGNKLLFSVTDDGCGFDPDNVPGLEEGHFGLTGARERIEGFNGTLSIESGKDGTRITASMVMPPRQTTGNRHEN